MMKGVLHAPAVRWSRCSQLGSLQRWLCRLKVEKIAAKKIWRLIFSDLMLKRGAEADTSRSRLNSGWEKDSNNGLAAKVNRPLGWDLETVLDRRPNKEGLFNNIEDCWPSHLGPLTNMHTRDVLNKCLEMG